MTEDITSKSESPVNSTSSQLTSLCAVGLGFSFFLPWAKMIVTLSGFDLQKLGDGHRLLWAIPIFSVITIIAGVTNRSQKHVAQLTGALPFIVGIYWYSKIGSDMTNILTYGAYLSLIFGAALFVLPRNQK